jgi:hypothetical protein
MANPWHTAYSCFSSQSSFRYGLSPLRSALWLLARSAFSSAFKAHGVLYACLFCSFLSIFTFKFRSLFFLPKCHLPRSVRLSLVSCTSSGMYVMAFSPRAQSLITCFNCADGVFVCFPNRSQYVLVLHCLIVACYPDGLFLRFQPAVVT